MNEKEEAPSAWTASGGPQSARTTTKRNTRPLRFLGDSLRIVAALTIAVVIMAAAERFTQTAHPLIVLVSGIVGLIAALLLIAWREL